MKILWDSIRFHLVGFVDRRAIDQVIADRRRYDQTLEQRWREKVAANPKEQRRLAGRRWERCAAPGLIREGQSASMGGRGRGPARESLGAARSPMGLTPACKPTALQRALSDPAMLMRQAD